jgi:hypothetical protein
LYSRPQRSTQVRPSSGGNVPLTAGEEGSALVPHGHVETVSEKNGRGGGAGRPARKAPDVIGGAATLRRETGGQGPLFEPSPCVGPSRGSTGTPHARLRQSRPQSPATPERTPRQGMGNEVPVPAAAGPGRAGPDLQPIVVQGKQIASRSRRGERIR